MKDIAVSDEQLEAYYNENIGNYRTNVARRRASHILIEFADDEAAAISQLHTLRHIPDRIGADPAVDRLHLSLKVFRRFFDRVILT